MDEEQLQAIHEKYLQERKERRILTVLAILSPFLFIFIFGTIAGKFGQLGVFIGVAIIGLVSYGYIQLYFYKKNKK